MPHTQDARAFRSDRLTRLLLFAVGLGILFWFLHALAMAYLFHAGSLSATLFSVNPQDLFLRILVPGFLIGFAIHANYLVGKRERVEGELLKLRKAVEASSEVIFLTDRDGTFRYVNPEFTRVYGYTAEEVIGKTTPRILKSDKMAPQDYEGFWADLQSGLTVRTELINKCKEGRLIPVEGSANTIRDGHGEIVGYLAIQRDISERKRVEQESRQRTKELAALNAIAATVSQSSALNQILHDTLDEVLRLRILGDEAHGMLFLLDAPSQTLRLAAQRGAPQNHPCLTNPVLVGECLCGLAAQQGETLICHHSLEDRRHTRCWPAMLAHKDICVPLLARGRNLGILELRLPLSYEITAGDVRLMKAVADQIGVAIENAQLKELRERAIVEERERIARELHDNMAQLLSYVNAKATSIRLLLENNRLSLAREYLTQLEEASLRLLNDARETILGLRLAGRLSAGLIPALQDYVVHFARLTHLPVELALAPGIEGCTLAAEAEVQLLRVVQEALSNAHRHAAATQATLSLQPQGSRLRVIIADNGTGFDPAAPYPDDAPHFGLHTMRERAEAVGGTLAIDSAPGAGTRVIVTVPA